MNPYRFKMQWTNTSISKACSSPNWIAKRSLVLLTSLLLYFGQLSAQCELDCIAQVHLSLDETCMAVVTPETVGETSTADMTLTLLDLDGNVIPNNEVGLNYVNQNLEYHITRTCGNACWGNILVEYKLAPNIMCPPDLTLTCGGLDALGLPPATSQCGGGTFEVFLLNETREQLTCDPTCTYIVERSYRAINSFGNFVDCSHTVKILRVDLSAISFPDNATVSCSDPKHIFANGFPIPWIEGSPLTGSGSGMIPQPGVPVLCDPMITNGLVCPATGSGSSGVPLIPNGGASTYTPAGVTNMPGTGEVLCNSAITYIDMPLTTGLCQNKIIRQWEVREWWCSGETSIGGLQEITVVDDQAPEFVCPADFTVSLANASTNPAGDCIGTVTMPPIVVTDACSNGASVNISGGIGLIQTNGGEILLEAGTNVVTYTVNDDCYNSATCQVNVTVNDGTKPVAICEQDVVVSISTGANTFLTADALDDGSWDECGIDDFQVRRMTTDCDIADLDFGDQVEFCCSDVQTDIMVVFRVIDISGNFNDCMVRVDVQDLVNPVLTCPADMTIDCRDTYDPANLSATFGHPSQMDNCVSVENITEGVQYNLNQCNIGFFTRIFRLRDAVTNSVLQTCRQRITIGNVSPFTIANITWPADYENLNGCIGTGISPSSLPSGFDVPTYTNDDNCSLLGVDYEDTVVAAAGSGVCAHIERTWTVINWCGTKAGQFDQYTSPVPQIIKIYNTTPPVIDPDPGIVQSTQNVDCLSQPISVTRTATDDCSDPLTWTYLVTHDPSGVMVASGSTNSFSGTLNIGDYNISWRAEDQCGNFSFVDQKISITSTKAPTPVCVNGLTADINNAAMELELWASDFDGGSFHTCNNPIAVSFSADPTDTNVTYDCDLVGTQPVTLYVTDMITMTQDFCTTTIEVLDPGNCPPMSNMLTVSGEVFTENLEELENVEVYLDNTNQMSMTSAEGEYAFPNMPTGGAYNVVPLKDNNYLDGVSTLDLVLIQRHILGLESLDSPYKLIAADVDATENITAKDLIAIRKLILGIHEKYEFNTSWRFVDDAHNFVDDRDPWLFEIPESYQINSLADDMDIDFIGVKIGDVNGSAESNLNQTSLEERSSRWPLVFNIENENEGSLRKAIVSAQNYERITGWQTSLIFDATQIEVVELNGLGIDLEEQHYSLTLTESGVIPISFNTTEEVDLNNGDALFEIIYQVKNDSENDITFELGSQVTLSEAYRGLREIVNLESKQLKAETLSIKSANPNPWISETVLEFDVPQNGIASWEFYDVTGRVLMTKEQNCSKGHNTINVQKSELNTTGVVYAKLNFGGASAEYKMMIIK